MVGIFLLISMKNVTNLELVFLKRAVSQNVLYGHFHWSADYSEFPLDQRVIVPSKHIAFILLLWDSGLSSCLQFIQMEPNGATWVITRDMWIPLGIDSGWETGEGWSLLCMPWPWSESGTASTGIEENLQISSGCVNIRHSVGTPGTNCVLCNVPISSSDFNCWSSIHYKIMGQCTCSGELWWKISFEQPFPLQKPHIPLPWPQRNGYGNITGDFAFVSIYSE